MSEGASAIINPFAVQPNTSITKYNPFNTHAVGDVPVLKEVEAGENGNDVAVREVRQIDGDRFMVVDREGFVKLFARNEENGEMPVFDKLQVHGKNVSNLFNAS